MMKNIRTILVIIAVAACVLVAGALVLFNTVEPVRWRVAMLMRYLDGGIGDVTLRELLIMMQPKTKFNLDRVAEGRGISAAVQSPYDTEEGVKSGATVYRERCAFCHGAEADGGSATSLKQRASYKHGGSDWSVYRVIASGIPGTNMPATELTFDQSWQIVSFLKSVSSDGLPVGQSGKTGATDLLEKYPGLPYEKLLSAGADNDEWRTYSRTYNGWRFSPLKQINTGNIGQLRPRWIRQLATSGDKVEASPIVVGGVMFITEPPNNVLALDAATGKVLWTYRHEFTERLSLCCGQVNRGVAVLDDKVYIGTLDARLVALDAKTGKIAWNIKLGKPKDGYSSTGAPLAMRDLVISGMAGSEYPTRGFLEAVDAKTGKTRWRFYTIPGPGEPGHDTWGGDSWKTGGGSTWVTGSFDPELNLIYWGVSNPNPDFDGDGRPGDNLYTDSVIALDATTGRLKWHFQFTPHDEHDWGSNQTPVLTAIKENGVEIPIIAWANRNGFYYVLDRRDGRFIRGVPFTSLNWATGLDPKGRPILTQAAKVSIGGTLTRPSTGGGVNWQPPAFNPDLGLLFVNADESTGMYSKSGIKKEKREPYVQYLGGGSQLVGNRDTFVRALKVGTGEKVWEYHALKAGRESYSGLLATAGGLVFGAIGERLYALDAATGKELWTLASGGNVWQGPVSYSDHGQQVVTFISGRTVIAFSL